MEKYEISYFVVENHHYRLKKKEDLSHIAIKLLLQNETSVFFL